MMESEDDHRSQASKRVDQDLKEFSASDNRRSRNQMDMCQRESSSGSRNDGKSSFPSSKLKKLQFPQDDDVDKSSDDTQWILTQPTRLQQILREFSVFFIIVETCLLLLGYCVLFGAQLSLKYGYRILKTRSLSQPSRSRQIHRRRQVGRPQFVPVVGLPWQEEQQLLFRGGRQVEAIPVLVPRGRMTAG